MSDQVCGWDYIGIIIHHDKDLRGYVGDGFKDFLNVHPENRGNHPI